MKSRIKFILMLLLLSSTATVHSEDSKVKFYKIPSDGGLPAAIDTDSRGNVWLVENNSNAIYRFDPVSGQFSDFSIPTSRSSPVDIKASGNVIWFLENDGNQIGRFDPENHLFEEYDIPTPKSQPIRMAVDYKGNIWFTEFAGNKIGLFTPLTRTFKEFAIQTPMSQPTGIAVDRKGTVWFIETQGNKLGKLDPGSGKIREFPIPRSFTAPTEILIDKDGKIWFSARKDRRLVRFDPVSEKFTEFDLKGKGVAEGLAGDRNGNIWYSDKFRKKIGVCIPADNSSVEVELGSGDRKPLDITVTPQNMVWFTVAGTNEIGFIDGNKISKLDSAGLSVEIDTVEKNLLKQLSP